MSSLSPQELDVVNKCIRKVARSRRVAAACVYGSKAAGYSRPKSDIDLLVVLYDYPYAIKYAYLRESGIDISALIVDKESLHGDATQGSLGEFAIGRLLHIYEPIINAELLDSAERIYKRRVILEELQNIVDTAGLLSTDILFPLEYLAFSKIKRRIELYPSAVYSYFNTYSASASSKRNLNHALSGYRRALAGIISEDRQLFSRHDDLLRISEMRISVEKGRTKLKLAKRLREFGAYFVQTYAGRRIMHLAIKEAESKIRRHARQDIELPEFLDSPKRAYWRLSEGNLIIDSKDWLGDLAKARGIDDFEIVEKRRLGNVNSRTVLHVIRYDSAYYKVVAKEIAKTKSMKWAALSLWTAPVKRFKVDPLFRLGTEYKALRYIRNLGLHTPSIEAVVLDRRILATRFVEGMTLAQVIKDYIKGKGALGRLKEVGEQIARIHNSGASLGNFKPKNVIVGDRGLCFTDLEQFSLGPSDQVWDLAQFLCWGLKATGNSSAAAQVARAFIEGYGETTHDNSNVAKLARSRRYIESFYPVLAPSVARAIKRELKDMA
ncbi:MAG TPA: nucleotidyltransferase domain-containing protein [Nitrososphaera sp.]|nr:nucleotidyltransferase domain-containing protein [Nitrososphaera sp.]